MIDPQQLLPEGARVLAGPERVGSEQRWRVELGDGEAAQLGVLLPELARDESIRRRYLRDLERLRELEVPGLAPILDFGPKQDPRNPEGPPPWRLRAAPRGRSLAAWLDARAPAPIDEAVELLAQIAELVHRVHAAGAVLRDLQPRGIVLGEDDQIWLTDVGFARVDILSTRTAASLVLEGSPYASPEQLRATVLDQRSDLFALGVMLYQALTGSLPFGDGPSFLRDASKLLAPSRLRPEIPAPLDALVQACLADDPRARPDSAASLARALRGEAGAPGGSLARVACQSCGAALRVGQRLCLSCGNQAVLFTHASTPEQGRKRLVLRKIGEDAGQLARLRRFLASVSAAPLPSLDFVHGDQRMYSKAELERRIKLPITLFDQLDEPTAIALHQRMRAQGFEVKLADVRARGLSVVQRRGLGAGAAAGLALIFALALAAPIELAVIFGAMIAFFWLLALVLMRARSQQQAAPPLLSLRPAPAALPVSDPLVARLAALLRPSTAEDVREQVGELALLVQRLVDHRATLVDGRELELVSEPIEPLVGLIEAEVRALARLDEELARLDEGALVRALAASEARGDDRSAREPLLVGLDRLRTLEELRAKALHRLLEASSLLRRAVELGLEVDDPEAEHARNVQLALHALGGDEAS